MYRLYDKNDREISAAKIENASKKHEYKIKRKKELYPENEIFSLPFTAEEYGKRIRKMREVEGLTLVKLANEIGTSAATLSKIENGENKRLNIKLLYLLCAVFDTSPHYLFGLSPYPHLVQYADEKDGIRYLTNPIIQSEPVPALLTNELSKMAGVTDKAYLKDAELCKLLLYVLEKDNQEMRQRLKEAVQGICAIYLTPEEWRELKESSNEKI